MENDMETQVTEGVFVGKQGNGAEMETTVVLVMSWGIPC